MRYDYELSLLIHYEFTTWRNNV